MRIAAPISVSSGDPSGEVSLDVVMCRLRNQGVLASRLLRRDASSPTGMWSVGAIDY